MEFPGQMTLVLENPNTEACCRSTADQNREEKKEQKQTKEKAGPKTKENILY